MGDAEIEELAQAWIRHFGWVHQAGVEELARWHKQTRAQQLPWHAALAQAERNKDWERFTQLLHRNPSAQLDAPESDDQHTVDELWELFTHGDDDLGWRVILTLVRLAPDELLPQVGAGPFEDWMTEARAELFFDHIEAELARDPRFGVMVRAAWSMPKKIADAIAKPR